MEVEFVHFLLCVVHLLFGVLESFREDVEGIVVPFTGEVMACLLHKVFGFIDNGRSCDGDARGSFEKWPWMEK